MKQNKLLSVVAVVFALAITACGNKQDDAKHKHEWGSYVETKAATCTEDGVKERECKTCHEKQTQKITALGHDWEEKEVVTEPGCETEGVQNVECKRCHVKDTKKIDPAGHKFAAEADDVWTVVTPAKCEEPGSRTHECTVCHKAVAEDIQPLGHLYAKVLDAEGKETDEDVVQWTTKPTCEEGGVGVKACIREGCTHTEEVEAEALGHEWTTVDGQLTPAQGEGFADFYTFKCAHEGCDKVSLGFKASQPTVRSRDHLVFETNNAGEVGARFWGRPIGNALALDSDGTSVNQQNGEVVYCSTEEGDFFEYKFDLTAAQAETLSSCRCYCDAQAADYLNGTDFWAYGASNDEWTPGYYIDGGEGHFETNDDGSAVMVKDHAPAPKTLPAEDGSKQNGEPGEELATEVKMGKRIEDYRYILYVDGKPVDFDPTITAPTHGTNQSMRREEFVMPYTFNLHEGTNTISLRMAGGYRSVFYNFYFRQYIAPAPVTPAA